MLVGAEVAGFVEEWEEGRWPGLDWMNTRKYTLLSTWVGWWVGTVIGRMDVWSV